MTAVSATPKLSPELQALLAGLPAPEQFEIHSLSCLYGADHWAAVYCGFARPPALIESQWQHGWIPAYHAISPAMVICGEGEYRHLKETGKFSVARTDEVAYLHRHGYRQVKAIGLPITYLPPVAQARLPGRLLVMPVHSVETTTLAANFEAYAAAIDSIRGDFAEVVVCIHPACFAKGYWAESFRRRGYPLVTGATLYDRRGLQRVQRLMSGFEYVTTNGFGSHLAYAAYFGAKVSVFGPETDRAEQDYMNVPGYEEYPAGFWKLETQAAMREAYPFLFQAPAEARTLAEWGRQELGAENRPPPEELKEWLGWTSRRIFSWRVREGARTVKQAALATAGHWRRTVSDRHYRACHRSFRPVRGLTELQRGQIQLEGLPFDLLAGPQAREEFKEIFLQEHFRLYSKEKRLRIVDARAGCGLLATYYKTRFPEARITALEPEESAFTCLRDNLRRRGWPDCRPLKAFPWLFSGKACWSARAVNGVRVLPSDSAWEGEAIETFSLTELLAEPADLLRLELLDGEAARLMHTDAWLAQVRTVCLDYRSVFHQPQSLGTLFGHLQGAGFRLHLLNLRPAAQPLHQREVRGEHTPWDLWLRVFAFRQ